MTDPLDRNGLLARMPSDVANRIGGAVEFLDLEHGMILKRPGLPITEIYFPVDGIGSTLARGASERRIEVGLFGREGMSGSTVLLGGESAPLETIVQVPGQGFRLPVEVLRETVESSAEWRRLLLGFAYVMYIQATQTAVANGYGRLEERLARWLLMCHDRVEGDELRLKHQFLAVMLGVRRSGVTVGLHKIEGRGVIRAGRERIEILDRPALEEVANGSYGLPEREYARLIG